MKGIDRRNAAARIAAFVLATVYGARTSGVFAQPQPMFQPPVGSARLRRRVVRGLSDGEAIVVTRAWHIEFTPFAGGFEVTGKQASVEVEAPEKLRAFARIETERDERGLLPLMLGRDGLIATGTEQTADESVEQAAALANEIISRSAITAGDKRSSRAFLHDLHSGASEPISRLPRDLFLPRRLGYSEVRNFTGPVGEAGTLSISFEAKLAPSGGHVAHAERSVITSLNDMIQESSESWSLDHI